MQRRQVFRPAIHETFLYGKGTFPFHSPTVDDFNRPTLLRTMFQDLSILPERVPVTTCFFTYVTLNLLSWSSVGY